MFLSFFRNILNSTLKLAKQENRICVMKLQELREDDNASNSLYFTEIELEINKMMCNTLEPFKKGFGIFSTFFFTPLINVLTQFQLSKTSFKS